MPRFAAAGGGWARNRRKRGCWMRRRGETAGHKGWVRRRKASWGVGAEGIDEGWGLLDVTSHSVDKAGGPGKAECAIKFLNEEQ
jgi:hypothetical protein